MMTWLMGQSDQHCNWTIEDVHRLIIPPVALQQFRIWQVEHQPVGFVTWGLFNEETESGYLAGSRKIQPDDWNAGDRLWLVDFIAPLAASVKWCARADSICALSWARAWSGVQIVNTEASYGPQLPNRKPHLL